MMEPTKPGEWWAILKGRPWIGAGPQVVTVYIEDGKPTFDGMDDDEPLEDQIEFLAEVPTPDVCRVLPECEAAEAAWAAGDLDDGVLERAVIDAEARLYAALRAARKGQEVSE